MFQEDYRRIDAMMRQKGIFIHEGTGKPYYTGYEYATLYDWDQYFETIVQLYLGWETTYARSGVEIFLDLQREDGHIQRSSKGEAAQLSEHVKPFLAQICLLIYNRDGNLDFLRQNGGNYYKRMKKYLLYWLEKQPAYKGLPCWDSAPHTGMDNQHERAGYWYDQYCCGVDLASFLVRECQAFALIAGLFGEAEDVALFEDHAERIKATALDLMWDTDEGTLYDIDRRTGEKIRVRYIGQFAAMWAGLVSDPQAKSMVERYLMNPREFRRGFLYPAMAASEPGYGEAYQPGDLGCCWRANTWIPTNYYVFQSLRKYGYDDLAKELATQTYENVKRIGDREYYTTESKRGCGLDPFWGWSLLAYFMPYEEAFKYDPTQIGFEKNGHALMRRNI